MCGPPRAALAGLVNQMSIPLSICFSVMFDSLESRVLRRLSTLSLYSRKVETSLVISPPHPSSRGEVGCSSLECRTYETQNTRPRNPLSRLEATQNFCPTWCGKKGTLSGTRSSISGPSRCVEVVAELYMLTAQHLICFKKVGTATRLPGPQKKTLHIF